MKRLFVSTALVAGLAGMATADPYVAGDEIRVIQGGKPGGGSDQLAQLTEPYLDDLLEVTFLNEYLPGAAAAIAWTKVGLQSPKDGSVISVTNMPMLLTNYIMSDAVKYTAKDFTPIANVVTDPNILVVGPDSPYQTIDAFIEAAKAAPGQLTVGNSGVGGDDHFATLMLEKATGATFQKVPFQGDGPSATAAMGEKIDASLNNLGTVYSQVSNGTLRALAVFSKERSEFMPDVPTLMESGIDMASGSSRGFSAPAGIPDEARDQLIDAFKEMAASDAFKAQAKERALSLNMVYGDEYAEMMQSMETELTDLWAELQASAAN